MGVLNPGTGLATVERFSTPIGPNHVGQQWKGFCGPAGTCHPSWSKRYIKANASGFQRSHKGHLREPSSHAKTGQHPGAVDLVPLMFGNLFQRVSASPTNPHARPEAQGFDVADLYRGPLAA